MRTLLTYVLAALAAALIGTLAQSLLPGALGGAAAPGIASADAGSVADATARLAFLAFSAFVILALLGSLSWFVAFRLAGSLAQKLGLSGYAGLGSLVLFVTVVGWMSLFVAPMLVDFGIAPGTETGNSVLVQMLVSGLPWAIAGAIWGTVFWLRAPKPQTAGIAA